MIFKALFKLYQNTEKNKRFSCDYLQDQLKKEDLEDSMCRKKNLAIIILPFIRYGEEYRSFVEQGEYITTRSDKGITIDPNSQFHSIANILKGFYGKKQLLFLIWE